MIEVRKGSFTAGDREFNFKVYREELLLDRETPVSIFEKLTPLSPFILESADSKTRFGRHSFVAAYPLLSYRHSKGRGSFCFGGREIYTERTEDPLEPLNKLIKGVDVEKRAQAQGLFAGFCGYLSYDAFACFERRSLDGTKLHRFPTAYFILPAVIVAFDHRSGVTTLYLLEIEPGKARQLRQQVLSLIEGDASAGRKSYSFRPDGFGRVTASFRKNEFIEAVKRAREYIFSGDIYQVVLSQKFRYPPIIKPFDFYRLLRISNPSPYMFHFSSPEAVLVGASPEPLLKVEGGRVISRPIAGTRPRGSSQADDERFEAELLADAKEKAEHAMLVDLARNDIGRVSVPGSVRITELMTVEKYSHVMHLVSEVDGELDGGMTALDALKASFPAGTVSGAPKVRAAQIIAELEPEPRGIYAGAFGYVNLDGELDTCIVIRTAVFTEEGVEVQAGAGIVRDSIPEKEYEETLHKAEGLLSVLSRGVNIGAAAG